MFEYGDGDDFEISPTENSKLAALFGSPAPEIPSSNLMYTSPKQPSLPNVNLQETQTEQNTSKQPITEVLIVKVVSLWKLEDQMYKTLGRHGLGIIGSADGQVQELIAYKTKQSILLRAKITDDFLFLVQNDDFSSFYDNRSQNWLVKFETNDQQEFIDQLKCYGAKVVDAKNDSVKVLTVKPDHPKQNTLNPSPLVRHENRETGDQESDSAERKANILNRITKLGQQVVPKPPTTGSDVSDMEAELTRAKKHRKPKKVEKPKLPILEAPPSLLSQTHADHQLTLPSVSVMQIPMVYKPNDLNSYLLSQNQDLKVSLSAISLKLDALNIPKVCTDNSTLTSKVKALELKVENLETMVDNYKKRCSELEPKYLELLEKDKHFIEQKNATTNQLETQISDLKLELEVKTEQLDYLKRQREELLSTKDSLKKYEETIEDQNERIAELEKLCEDNKHNSERADTIESLNLLVENLNQNLKDLEDKYTASELERENMCLAYERRVKAIGDLIKAHMNDMYQKILGNYNEEYSYKYEEIKTALAENLKATTYNLIDEIAGIIGSNFDT